MRRNVTVGMRKVLKADLTIVVGCKRVIWKQQVEKDMLKAELRCQDVSDRSQWRQKVEGFPTSTEKH